MTNQERERRKRASATQMRRRLKAELKRAKGVRRRDLKAAVASVREAAVLAATAKRYEACGDQDGAVQAARSAADAKDRAEYLLQVTGSGPQRGPGFWWLVKNFAKAAAARAFGKRGSRA